jgi:GTP 3',8-cyclase
MFDRYNRRITYLRISVTDKCNLRCRYCMPEEGVALRRHEDLLSLEQLAEAARAAVGLGLTKIRLTGGEPLVRRGIADLVRMIASIEGLTHLGMTTNGTLLAARARELRLAGLSSVNVSLDTLDAERYRHITRGGDVRDALAGLRTAVAEGFSAKINMVVLSDTTPGEIAAMRELARSMGARVQLINHFDLTRRKTEGYAFDRPPACEGCNRIRLLADGTLKPCLHSDEELRLDPARPADSLRETILAKPVRGGTCTNRPMRQIGG